MKYIDAEKIKDLPGRRLKAGDTFAFRCHPQVACFNRCCRNLNLFLYPYDVLRLKNGLGIPSGQFLDEYVDVVLRPGAFFPEVLLRMAENEEKTCPFLTGAGCAVYPDRPDSCRTFPVEQGSLYDAGTGKSRPVHFFRPPDFCQGQHEADQWTVDTWISDQDARDYNRMTLAWAEIKRLFQADPWKGEGPEGPRAKMAFMATYNIDDLKKFVFESSFFKRYKVKKDVRRKIEASESALLRFGFEWVRLFVWGLKSKKIRPK
jgi:Fe-S-cluster containining protein